MLGIFCKGNFKLQFCLYGSSGWVPQYGGLVDVLENEKNVQTREARFVTKVFDLNQKI